jgi:hypothetical protein
MKKYAISGLLSMALMAPVVSAASPFVDIDPSHWAYKQIKSLYDAGIIRGDGTGKFKGNERISRYEAAALVYQAINYVNRHKAAGGTVDSEMMDTINSLMTELTDEMQVIEVRIEENSDAIAQLRNHLASMHGKPTQGVTVPMGQGRIKLMGQAMFSLISGGDDSVYNDGAATTSGVTEFTADYINLGIAADVDEKTSVYARINGYIGGHSGSAGVDGELKMDDYLYVHVKDMWSDWDMSLGRQALPWGHETAGMFRTNPYFVSNSMVDMFYGGMFTGAYFSTTSDNGEWDWGFAIHNGDFTTPDGNFTHLYPGNNIGGSALAASGINAAPNATVNNNNDDSFGYALHVGSQSDNGDFKWDVNYFTNGSDASDTTNPAVEMDFFNIGLDYRINDDWHATAEYVDGTLTSNAAINTIVANTDVDFTTWYLQVVHNLDAKSTLSLRYGTHEEDAGGANNYQEMDETTFAYARKISDNGTLLVEYATVDADYMGGVTKTASVGNKDDWDVIRASYRIDF